tara:strand:+ start:519 stop:2087 length:1569 start_codon:yes stop_codon:yes gene_type:complete
MADLKISTHPTDPDLVTINVLAFIRDFKTYIAITKASGARYDKDLNTQVAPASALPSVVAGLEQGAFEVMVDKPLQAHIEKAKASQVSLEGTELYPFQKEDVKWIQPRKAALLASQMGTGKTPIALMALPAKGRSVVVCPASLKYNWYDECEKWRPDIQPVILAGRNAMREPEVGELLIINYDILPKPKSFEVAHAWTLVADEAHYLKSSKSGRHKAFKDLSRQVNKTGGRTWLMTGTPIMNQPLELWYILTTAGIETAVFDNWKTFIKLFNGHPGRWGGYEFGKPGPEVRERLQRVARRRTRKQVLPQLPDKVYKPLTVEIDREAVKLCNELVERLENWDEIIHAIAGSKSTKDAKIAFEEFSAVRRELASAKTPAMLKIVEDYEDSQTPLVVFSAHTAPIEAVTEREGWACITGEVNPEKRQDIVRRFQAGELKGVGLTIQAGGVGLTLTHAHNALFVDQMWTPADNMQAEDRVCRIGQDKGVIITQLVANHKMDQHLHKVLSRKTELIEATIRDNEVMA